MTWSEGDTQHMTVTVRDVDTNDRVSDAEVRLTVHVPIIINNATDETDSDGEARFNVKVDDDAETGGTMTLILESQRMDMIQK